jgi:hypothetical protein
VNEQRRERTSGEEGEAHVNRRRRTLKLATLITRASSSLFGAF